MKKKNKTMLLFSSAIIIFLAVYILAAISFQKAISFDLERKYLNILMQMDLLCLVFLIPCVKFAQMVESGKTNWFSVLFFVGCGISIVKINQALTKESNNVHNEVVEELGVDKWGLKSNHE